MVSLILHHFMSGITTCRFKQVRKMRRWKISRVLSFCTSWIYSFCSNKFLFSVTCQENGMQRVDSIFQVKVEPSYNVSILTEEHLFSFSCWMSLHLKSKVPLFSLHLSSWVTETSWVFIAKSPDVLTISSKCLASFESVRERERSLPSLNCCFYSASFSFV